MTYAPPRHLLVSLPRDAEDAARTMSYVAENVARTDDRVTLLHVRQADLTSATPLAYDAKEEPLGSLAEDLLIGSSDEAASTATDAAAAIQRATGAADRVRLVKLRSPLRVIDALVAYINSLSDNKNKADALVMGSHVHSCPPECVICGACSASWLAGS